MKVGRILAAWIALFVVTLGIRAIVERHTASSHAAGAANAAGQPTDDALTEFRAKPRKNAFVIESAPNGDESPLGAGVRESLQNHMDDADGLRACKAKIMKQETRSTEYFEVSFIPTALGPAESGTRAKLTLVGLNSVVLERNTLDLSADDEDCILTVFRNLELTLDKVPSGRFSYEFCFHAAQIPKR